MDKTLTFSTFSIINKEEKIKDINHHIIKNTGVLEITHPFPGYYDSTNIITSKSKPGTLFLLLKKKASLEYFYRRYNSIKKYSKYEFEAELAEITVYNKIYQAIRLYALDSYNYIIDIQKYFIDEGFELRKPIDIESKALIKIFKFCSLENINDIYFSTINPHFVYFKIETKLTWKKFETITQHIRHNFDNKKFDAATGLFFRDGNVEDVIRIYTKDLNAEDINSLKKLYTNAIKNF